MISDTSFCMSCGTLLDVKTSPCECSVQADANVTYIVVCVQFS